MFVTRGWARPCSWCCSAVCSARSARRRSTLGTSTNSFWKSSSIRTTSSLSITASLICLPPCFLASSTPTVECCITWMAVMNHLWSWTRLGKSSTASCRQVLRWACSRIWSSEWKTYISMKAISWSALPTAQPMPKTSRAGSSRKIDCWKASAAPGHPSSACCSSWTSS